MATIYNIVDFRPCRWCRGIFVRLQEASQVGNALRGNLGKTMRCSALSIRRLIEREAPGTKLEPRRQACIFRIDLHQGDLIECTCIGSYLGCDPNSSKFVKRRAVTAKMNNEQGRLRDHGA